MNDIKSLKEQIDNNEKAIQFYQDRRKVMKRYCAIFETLLQKIHMYYNSLEFIKFLFKKESTQGRVGIKRQIELFIQNKKFYFELLKFLSCESKKRIENYDIEILYLTEQNRLIVEKNPEILKESHVKPID